MKVRPSGKPICEKCKIIKRKGRDGNLRKPEAQAEAGVNAPQRIVNDSEAAASVLAKVRVIRGSSSITQALASLSERGSGGADAERI